MFYALISYWALIYISRNPTIIIGVGMCVLELDMKERNGNEEPFRKCNWCFGLISNVNFMSRWKGKTLEFFPLRTPASV